MTAPASHAAVAATSTSRPLGSTSRIRSPGRTPSAINALASLLASSWSARFVHSRSPTTRSGKSPYRSRWRRDQLARFIRFAPSSHVSTNPVSLELTPQVPEGVNGGATRHMFQHVSNSWVTQALYVAAKLGVADALAAG